MSGLLSPVLNTREPSGLKATARPMSSNPGVVAEYRWSHSVVPASADAGAGASRPVDHASDTLSTTDRPIPFDGIAPPLRVPRYPVYPAAMAPRIRGRPRGRPILGWTSALILVASACTGAVGVADVTS